MTSPFPPSGLRVDPPAVRRAVRFALGALAGFFVVFVVLPWLGSFVIDWLWYKEVGFEPVFVRSFFWKIGLVILRSALAFAFFYGNIWIARPRTTRAVALVAASFRGAAADVDKFVPPFLLLVSLLIALFIGVAASDRWLSYLLAYHGGQTGITDPLFGRDIGFYLFRLPAISSALATIVALNVLSLIAVIALYAVQAELVLVPQRWSATPGARRHLGTLLAFLFLLFAVQLWIVDRADLLSSTTGPLVGASYTDVHANLSGIAISAAAALVAAGLVVFGTVRGALFRYAVIAVVVYAGAGVLARVVAPFAIQKLIVLPNELDRETPYLKNHIQATRRAWGLDSVQTRDLAGEADLTMADIRANAPTITNVRLWERDLLKQTFGQLQEIRTYYEFVSVNDDRYTIDGKYRQVHIAARELNAAKLPTRGFINEQLTFTHGMGITMAPVNEVTPEGLPVLFVKDLPPVSTVSLKLTRPQIYYGELTDSYVFVGTGQKEFDYPAGDANMYTNYTGRGGVPIGSWLRRALFAWQFGSLKILFSSDLKDSARVLFRRNIKERAKAALPFLEFDPEPYLIVTDSGKLVWILDAYTTSEYYPYAERTADGVSYMRNSVKVTIDAYDGTVNAYLIDPADEIVQAYSRIFVGVFKPLGAMPADVRRHLRYPAQLFRIQAALLGTYHMVQPESFYHREDEWQMPGVSDQGRTLNPYLRHIILRLPGEKNEEFIYMTPFNPKGKDNLAAWFVARMDGDNYGKLVVYRFPKQSLVYGPKQIANRIEQDPDISRQLSLWDQHGSQVIRGELLVIPIEESLIYVQPIYLRATGGAIPELKRVVVAHGNRVAMGETLEDGLAAVFGTGAQRPAATVAQEAAGAGAGATVASLLQQAQQHYDRAIAAQRAGNWADYGREIDLLGGVLKELKSRQK
jgi:uncharacterized membrane protein (UPF0182 family)